MIVASRPAMLWASRRNASIAPLPQFQGVPQHDGGNGPSSNTGLRVPAPTLANRNNQLQAFSVPVYGAVRPASVVSDWRHPVHVWYQSGVTFNRGTHGRRYYDTSARCAENAGNSLCRWLGHLPQCANRGRTAGLFSSPLSGRSAAEHGRSPTPARRFATGDGVCRWGRIHVNDVGCAAQSRAQRVVPLRQWAEIQGLLRPVGSRPAVGWQTPFGRSGPGRSACEGSQSGRLGSDRRAAPPGGVSCR